MKLIEARWVRVTDGRGYLYDCHRKQKEYEEEDAGPTVRSFVVTLGSL
jgi:outer membrane protease